MLDVAFLHSHDVVEMTVVVKTHLSSMVSFAGDAVTLEDVAGRGVKGVAPFFVAGGGGVYLKMVFETGFAYHVGKDVFCHGTSANVAETDEKDGCHFLQVQWAHLPVLGSAFGQGFLNS